MTFEELVKKISPTLKRITYKLNGHRVFFNDEDLYQEALLHLWQDFQTGRLDNKTDSYILQGCYFHLKNYIRNNKIRMRFISLDSILNREDADIHETSLLEDKSSSDYLDCLNDKYLVETIQNNGLTLREKDVLLLCAEGLTTREIGLKLNISHVRVVKLMAQIRQKCKKYRDDLNEGLPKRKVFYL